MPFRFGLIGAGAVAVTHIDAMRSIPDVEVGAVTDLDRSRAQALAARYGIPEVYETTEALVEKAPVDAVAVLTPHHMHLPAVRIAARSGKHVLVEKAIAPTVAAADEMIEVCRSHQVTLGGIFQNRFSQSSRALRDAVQGGSLGRVFLVSVSTIFRRSAEYYRKGPWRTRKHEAGGGVLMIQGIHTVDLLQWVMGMPKRVMARTANAVHQTEVEDTAAGLLQWDTGAIGLLQSTTAAVPEIPQELEVRGDKGTALVFDSRGYLGFWSSTLDRPTPLPERWNLFASHYHEQEATTPLQASTEPHAENIRDFVTAVRAGRQPLVDGHEARKAVVIVDALYRSAASGSWADLLPTR